MGTHFPLQMCLSLFILNRDENRLFACFCQISASVPKINVPSYNSLSTFNVCMAANVKRPPT